MSEDVIVNSRLTIPAQEIRFTAGRSSGPGGQHVNTADTRVELRWDVTGSAVLSEAQRATLVHVLASRINRRGELILRSEVHRSQHRNRQEVVARFAQLLARALQPRKQRRRTKPSASSRERRLHQKRRRSDVKRRRRRPAEED